MKCLRNGILNHANIVTVYDVDTVDGVDFIAMEYIDGQTLDHRIGGHGMRLNLVLKYAVQMADALSARVAGGRLAPWMIFHASLICRGRSLIFVSMSPGSAFLIASTDSMTDVSMYYLASRTIFSPASSSGASSASDLVSA